jgi:hypothetical protein
MEIFVSAQIRIKTCMNQSNRQAPYGSILLLLLIGAAATVSALWLVDHRQAVPNSEVIIAVLVGVFFMSFTWAFLRYLRWRDKTRATIVTLPSQVNPADLEGTVYGMIPGREYQVMKSFTDHYGNAFERGERLQFQQRHFLPYHGGHTIVFKERALYLHDDQNREILDHFSEYIILV